MNAGWQALLGNQFFSGGLILMLTGALMATLRQTPVLFWKWLKQQFTVTVTINDRDPLFEWSKLWLDALPYAKRTRTLVCNLHRECDEEFSTDSRMIFAPGYGLHFFRHKRRLIWLEYAEAKQPTANSGMATTRAPEVLRITILSRRQDSVRELVEEIRTHAANEEKRRPRAYISGCGWWRRMLAFRPRDLATVDLPLEDERQIIASIEDFLGARAVYNQRGIPYHLNFLFEGRPGTGKTSLASALCGYFGLNLHLLNIAGPGMNDERLVELMLGLPRRSMVLMEDVDALVPESRARPRMPQPAPTGIGAAEDTAQKAPEGVTLSGLLNCMDGITAPDGAVIVMTTNHPELIDPALLRPGRVDIRVHFGSATREQIAKMCARLAPNRKLNGEMDAMLSRELTTAEVQAELLAMDRGSGQREGGKPHET